MGYSSHNNVAKGTIWSAIDKFSIVIMQFIINLVLARLLTPDDFGLVGMILIIVAVSNILTDGGFGAALIQKHDPNEKDFSTAFYINVITSVLLYIIIYISAPIIAEFLGSTLLVNILRVISVVIVINSLGLVPKVKLRRALAFKQIAIANITAYIISAATAIYLAHQGYGAWGLIAMHIINAVFSNLFISITAHWLPTLTFSTKSLKKLFAFGEYMLISDILSNICFHIQSTLVGKYFSPYTAGQYAQAKKMEEVACITLPSAMNQVLFPLYSRLQHDTDEIRRMLRLNTKMIAYTIFPLMTILIIVAKPLILFLFGSKWMDSVSYFQVLCVGGYFCSLQYFNYQAVAAIGQSRILFYAGLLKSLFLITSILVGVHISMEAVLVAMVLSNVVNYLTNAIIAQRYIKYTLAKQIWDITPILIISLVIGGIVYLISYVWSIHWILLILIYLILYICISYATKSEITMLTIGYLKQIR
ncbi:MAG: lipopolysaccharide biosynthesis protein [Alistipes sp.]|nr:lipopolysaccharide biosynthesis protein [Alistipes sp.]